MNNDLFPEIVRKVEPPKADPCLFPFFIVAYWPRGGYWSVFKEMYGPVSIDMKRAIIRLENNGWTHITVMRLPDSLWS